jgi:hypothetical protein
LHIKTPLPQVYLRDKPRLREDLSRDSLGPRCRAGKTIIIA